PQAKAEEAPNRQSFDQAQSLFNEAQKTYRLAAKTASDKAASDSAAATAAAANTAALKRELEEADQARRAATQARLDAERADAKTLAPHLYAPAQAEPKH